MPYVTVLIMFEQGAPHSFCAGLHKLCSKIRLQSICGQCQLFIAHFFSKITRMNVCMAEKLFLKYFMIYVLLYLSSFSLCSFSAIKDKLWDRVCDRERYKTREELKGNPFTSVSGEL